MTQTIPPATPELDRLRAVLPKAELLTEFVDWLNGQGIALCSLQETGRTWTDGPERLWLPHSEPYERLFERFFGLDPNKMETERRALLDYLRAKHGEPPLDH